MDSTPQIKHALNPALHPGETVVEYLEFYGWSQRDLARRTSLTPKTISEICNGKAPITTATALAFERVFRRPAHFWMNLQRDFDEAHVRSRELSKTFEWQDWASGFPLKEMRRLRYTVPAGASDADEILHFFGVTSPESWNAVWRASAIHYRQTRAFNVREEAIAAWVREAELIARQINTREFNADLFVSSLAKLRKLTRVRADEIMDPLQNICATAGVAVVLVPELRNTHISGCARWLSETKAMIGLTLRYKRDDQFWFTFFHECGHLLLHRSKRPFVLDNAAEDLSDRVIDPEMQKYESEANAFSADTLIPPRELGAFIKKNKFTNDTIHEFAERLDIGPGIIVGRLQFEGILERHQGNALKQRINWEFAGEE
jgi:HTH-type transcriptional regulator / antitoxin HigA